jgi:heme-degrading monooxygenase HmoA
MIARLGIRTALSEPAYRENERNLRERLIPVLVQQAGFRGASWGRTAQRDSILSFSLYESEEALHLALPKINAAPLLPGQQAALLSAPTTLLVCAILHEEPGKASASWVSLAFFEAKQRPSAEEEQRWRGEEVPSFLRSLPGLAHAYLLRPPHAGRWLFSLFWQSEADLIAGQETLRTWSQQERGETQGLALALTETLAYEVFLQVGLERAMRTGTGAPSVQLVAACTRKESLA